MCRKLALFGMLAALVLSSGVEAGQEASKPLVASGSYITLEKGKSVYVVGVEAASRDRLGDIARAPCREALA